MEKDTDKDKENTNKNKNDFEDENIKRKRIKKKLTTTLGKLTEEVLITMFLFSTQDISTPADTTDPQYINTKLLAGYPVFFYIRYPAGYPVSFSGYPISGQISIRYNPITSRDQDEFIKFLNIIKINSYLHKTL